MTFDERYARWLQHLYDNDASTLRLDSNAMLLTFTCFYVSDIMDPMLDAEVREIFRWNGHSLIESLYRRVEQLQVEIFHHQTSSVWVHFEREWPGLRTSLVDQLCPIALEKCTSRCMVMKLCLMAQFPQSWSNPVAHWSASNISVLRCSVRRTKAPQSEKSRVCDCFSSI